MNITNWNKAFENLGKELVDMKLPIIKNRGQRAFRTVYQHQTQRITMAHIGLPQRLPEVLYVPFTIAEQRHLDFAEMTINSMYGKFYCPNPKCNSKNWSSTSCNTSMKYRYDEFKQRGEIIIESGLLRIIKICRRQGGQMPRRVKSSLFSKGHRGAQKMNLFY